MAYDLPLCLTGTETPTLVYDLPKLLRNAERLLRLCSVSGATPLISLKANRNVKIVNRLFTMGYGADVASPHELSLVRRCGVQHLSATSPGLTPHMFGQVDAAGGCVYFDSLDQINEVVDAGFDPTGHGIRIAVPGRYSRFGVSPVEARTSVVVEYGLHRRLHFHGGEYKNLQDVDRRADYVKGTSSDLGCKELNLGGGYAVLSNEWRVLRSAFERFRVLTESLECALFVEFGRVLFARYASLAVRVLSVKTAAGAQVVVVDASAWNVGPWDTHRLRVKDAETSEEALLTTVMGNTCFERDVFVFDQPFRRLVPGDVVLLSGFGAYAESLLGQLHGLAPPHIVTEWRV